MIELRNITPENHLEVRALCVREDQQMFVASVDKSLADAFVWTDAQVRAAYYNQAPFGFVMIFPFEQERRQVVNIVRLLVDAQHQGKGLGRELLRQTLAWIESLGVDRVRISTVPDNEVALGLYKDIGFVETGIEDEEVALYLQLPSKV